MGSDESHFNVLLIVRDKVCTDHNFWRQRRTEADSNQGPSAYQPNALPLGQTSSLGSRQADDHFHIALFSALEQTRGAFVPSWMTLKTWQINVSLPFKVSQMDTRPPPCWGLFSKGASVFLDLGFSAKSGPEQLTPRVDNLKHHVRVLLCLQEVKGMASQLAVLGERRDRQRLHWTQLQTNHETSLSANITICKATKKYHYLQSNQETSLSAKQPRNITVCKATTKLLHLQTNHKTSISANITICKATKKHHYLQTNHETSLTANQPQNITICKPTTKHYYLQTNHKTSLSANQPQNINICKPSTKHHYLQTSHKTSQSANQPRNITICKPTKKHHSLQTNQETSLPTNQPRNITICKPTKKHHICEPTKKHHYLQTNQETSLSPTVSFHVLYHCHGLLLKPS